MIIEKAEIGDLQTILDLQYLAYQQEAQLLDNFNIQPLKQTLPEVKSEYEKGVILKAVNENGEIIGSVRGYDENGTVYIGKLMVHPQYQRQGIATKLLSEIEHRFFNSRFELFTSARSFGNISLYKKCGYRVFMEKPVTEKLTFVYFEKLPI